MFDFRQGGIFYCIYLEIELLSFRDTHVTLEWG